MQIGCTFLWECSLKQRVGDQLNPQLPVSSHAFQASVLGSLLFPIFINDFPVSNTSRCCMFTNDIKLIHPTNEVDSLLDDLGSAFFWTSIWDMELNVAKSQHFHLGPESAPPLVVSNDTWDLLVVALVQQTTDLGVSINSEFISPTQVTAAVSKAMRMLSMFNSTF